MNISTLTKDEIIKNHFKDILMIIYTSWSPPIKVLATQDRLWRRTIGNIVYYGPFGANLMEELKKRGIMSFYRSDDDIKPQGVVAGHRSVIDAMYRFKNFSGYLYRHDDFFIHVPSMMS